MKTKTPKAAKTAATKPAAKSEFVAIPPAVIRLAAQLKANPRELAADMLAAAACALDNELASEPTYTADPLQLFVGGDGHDTFDHRFTVTGAMDRMSDLDMRGWVECARDAGTSPQHLVREMLVNSARPN